MIHIKLFRTNVRPWSTILDADVDVCAEPLTIVPEVERVNHGDNFSFRIHCNEDSRKYLDATKWHFYLGYDKDEKLDERPQHRGKHIFAYDGGEREHVKSESQWFFQGVWGKVPCRLAFEDRTVLQWTQDVRVEDGATVRKDFETVRSAIEEVNHALLLDIHGKGYLSIRRGEGSSSVALIELQVLPLALEKLRSATRLIQNKPHSRMIPRLVREAATPDANISDASLQEACSDPDILVRRQVDGKPFFRENIVQTTIASHDRPENRMILEFLRFLHDQHCRVLRDKLGAEIRRQQVLVDSLDERPNDDWKKKEQKRLDLYHSKQAELGRLRPMIRSELRRLAQLWKIDRVSPLSRLPSPTPLVRKHQGYSEAYRIVRDYFSRFRLESGKEPPPEAHPLEHGVVDIPRMYEYWCLLHLVRILRSLLRLKDVDSDLDLSALLLDSVPSRLAPRFSDRPIEFLDGNNHLLRLYYEKKYYKEGDPCGNGVRYGKIGGPGDFFHPDFSLEIFDVAADNVTLHSVPTKIIFFDAKYTVKPHATIREELSKYWNIRAFHDTDRRIIKQLWGLTFGDLHDDDHSGALDSPIPNTTTHHPPFWTDTTMCEILGAIQVRPGSEVDESRSPLRQLVEFIFRRLGVASSLRRRSG